MIEIRDCPYCGKFCSKSDDYVVGKQKIKQYFHYDCMVLAAAGAGGNKNDKNNSDVRSDTSDPDKLRS